MYPSQRDPTTFMMLKSSKDDETLCDKILNWLPRIVAFITGVVFSILTVMDANLNLQSLSMMCAMVYASVMLIMAGWLGSISYFFVSLCTFAGLATVSVSTNDGKKLVHPEVMPLLFLIVVVVATEVFLKPIQKSLACLCSEPLEPEMEIEAPFEALEIPPKTKKSYFKKKKTTREDSADTTGFVLL